MDVRAVVSSVFDQNEYLFLYCLDFRNEQIINLQNIPCLELYMVPGHVSFPSNLQERSFVLILHSEENINKIRGCNTPIAKSISVLPSAHVCTGSAVKSLFAHVNYIVVIHSHSLSAWFIIDKFCEYKLDKKLLRSWKTRSILLKILVNGK